MLQAAIVQVNHIALTHLQLEYPLAALVMLVGVLAVGGLVPLRQRRLAVAIWIVVAAAGVVFMVVALVYPQVPHGVTFAGGLFLDSPAATTMTLVLFLIALGSSWLFLGEDSGEVRLLAMAIATCGATCLLWANTLLAAFVGGEVVISGAAALVVLPKERKEFVTVIDATTVWFGQASAALMIGILLLGVATGGHLLSGTVRMVSPAAVVLGVALVASVPWLVIGGMFRSDARSGRGNGSTALGAALLYLPITEFAVRLLARSASTFDGVGPFMVWIGAGSLVVALLGLLRSQSLTHGIGWLTLYSWGMLALTLSSQAAVKSLVPVAMLELSGTSIALIVVIYSGMWRDHSRGSSRRIASALGGVGALSIISVPPGGGVIQPLAVMQALVSGHLGWAIIPFLALMVLTAVVVITHLDGEAEVEDGGGQRWSVEATVAIAGIVVLVVTNLGAMILAPTMRLVAAALLGGKA